MNRRFELKLQGTFALLESWHEKGMACIKQTCERIATLLALRSGSFSVPQRKLPFVSLSVTWVVPTLDVRRFGVLFCTLDILRMEGSVWFSHLISPSISQSSDQRTASIYFMIESDHGTDNACPCPKSIHLPLSSSCTRFRNARLPD